MALRSLIPAGTIARRFGAPAPVAAADFGSGAGRGARNGAGAFAGAGVGDNSHAAAGDTPSAPVSEFEADTGARVEALIKLLVSVWQPAPLLAPAAADRGPPWRDASPWAQADPGGTKSSRSNAFRAAMAACTRLSSWPAGRDDRPGRRSGPGELVNGPQVALAD